MGARRPRVGLISILSGDRGLHECSCSNIRCVSGSTYLVVKSYCFGGGSWKK